MALIKCKLCEGGDFCFFVLSYKSTPSTWQVFNKYFWFYRWVDE